MTNDEDQILQSISSSETRLYPKRWFMLALFMLMIFLNGALYAMFSPLAAIMVRVYDVDIFAINLNSILMVLLYVPSTFFLANPMFKYVGIYFTLLSGCALNVLCLWCRVLINQSFYIAMAGGMFYGIAQPLLMNANADIATNWFASSERPIAMTLASMMGAVGGGFGFAYHFIFITSEDNSENIDIGNAKSHIFSLLLSAAIIFTTLFAFACAFFREKPLFPPTLSANTKTVTEILPLLKSLVKDWNYILILHAFSFVYGSMTTFSQEVALIIEPFGFNSSVNAALGICFSLVGLVGAYLSATFISKTEKYRLATTVVCIGSMGAGVILCWSLLWRNAVACTISAGLLGFFVMSILAVALDYACECTFPIPGSATIGAMFSYSQIVCTIHILIASAVLVKTENGEDPVRAYKQLRSLGIAIMLVGSMAAGLIFAVFTKEDLRKKRLDSQNSITEGERIQLSNRNHSKNIFILYN